MDFLKLLIRFTAYTSCLLLLIGLYKPWVVLWWEHSQNRKKVILLYGLLALALYLLQLLL
ncbi:MAG: hypothetical protein EBU52_16745 [Cytophagia bacterium]|nr:hypothetical protein [Cytophagia bacterium]